jgi:hypothetical protein
VSNRFLYHSLISRPFVYDSQVNERKASIFLLCSPLISSLRPLILFLNRSSFSFRLMRTSYANIRMRTVVKWRTIKRVQGWKGVVFKTK